MTCGVIFRGETGQGGGGGRPFIIDIFEVREHTSKISITFGYIYIYIYLYVYIAGNDNFLINPLMAIGNNSYQFLICCPRDAVSRTANEKLVTVVANGR